VRRSGGRAGPYRMGYEHDGERAEKKNVESRGNSGPSQSRAVREHKWEKSMLSELESRYSRTIHENPVRDPTSEESQENKVGNY